MQKVNYLLGRWQNAVFFLAASLIVVADQLSKAWIRSHLLLGTSMPEVGLFRITHLHNTGAAFGLFEGQTFALSIVALVSSAALLVYVIFVRYRFSYLNGILGTLILGLVLGGMVGNLIDRLYFGYVTDFIAISIWPPFNIADSAVVVGAIMVAYSLLILSRTSKK